MLVNARHFPEMAKQIGNDPGLIFLEKPFRPTELADTIADVLASNGN